MKTKYLAGILLLAAGLFVSSCSDDDDIAISMDKIISTVETGNAEVTAVSATVTGTVKDLTGQSADAYSVGVVYSTTENPASSGTRVVGTLAEDGSTVKAVISRLTKGVTYRYCIYVTLQDKLTTYGDVKSFTTTDAQVGTADAASLTAVSVVLGGTLNGVSDMMAEENPSLAYGVVVATTDSEDAVKSGRQFAAASTANSYTVGLNGLLPNTAYYYMAYMALDNSYVYGEKKSFTTPGYDMEYVDLGLSVEWATCNLGAMAPDELGGLYGWADLSGLKTSAELADYEPASDIWDTEFDLCKAVGVGGRMPSFKEAQELLSKCSALWVTKNGVAGYEFTGLNGNSIFLPAAGSRAGSVTQNAGVQGLYWTGSVNAPDTGYGYILNLASGRAAWGTSLRSEGLSIRPVREPEIKTLYCDNSKIQYGDLESNNNYRIQLFNMGDKSQAPIELARLVTTDNMCITFRLTGIDGNLQGGAAGKYAAVIGYAAAGWWPSYWGAGNARYDCEVSGDGTYRVWWEGAANSAEVLCVDIKGLAGDLTDVDAVSAEIVSIELDRRIDWIAEPAIDNTTISFVNKDNDGTNGRIDIYNAYSSARGINPSDINFRGRMSINFMITGIDGNRKGDAANEYYTADIGYTTSGWWPSNAGDGTGTGITTIGVEDNNTHTITYDGTYEVSCTINDGDCVGSQYLAVELLGLWADLENTDGVSVTVNSIILEQKK